MENKDIDISKDEEKKEIKEEKEEKAASAAGDEPREASRKARPPLPHYQPPEIPEPKLFGRAFTEAIEQASELLIRMAREGVRCVVAVEGGAGCGKTAMVRAICAKVKNVLTLDPFAISDTRSLSSFFVKGRLLVYDNTTMAPTTSIANLMTSQNPILLAAYDPNAVRCSEVSAMKEFADLTIRIELPDADTAAQIVNACTFGDSPRCEELRAAVIRFFSPHIGTLTPREIVRSMQFVVVEVKRLERTLAPAEAAESIVARIIAPLLDRSKREQVVIPPRLKYVDTAAVRRLFENRIIGQDAVLDRIQPWIVALKSGFRDQSRPAGVFLFYGATGCGKTETARVIADELFAGRLHKEDMNTYNSEHSVARFIGSPPGYIDSGKLTPFLSFIGGAGRGGVLLLDEIEKAHPVVMDHIMEMLDTGFFRSASGNVLDARCLFIIMTSNVVTSRSAGSRAIGFEDAGDHENSDIEPLRKSGVFRNEFLGRIQLAAFFEELGADAVRAIAVKLYGALLDGVPPELRTSVYRDKDIDDLAAAYDHKMGARSLRNYISASLKMKVLRRCNESMLQAETAEAEGAGK